jgi:hypothetical protein
MDELKSGRLVPMRFQSIGATSDPDTQFAMRH